MVYCFWLLENNLIGICFVSVAGGCSLGEFIESTIAWQRCVLRQKPINRTFNELAKFKQAALRPVLKAVLQAVLHAHKLLARQARGYRNKNDIRPKLRFILRDLIRGLSSSMGKSLGMQRINY